jgi:hypothetical protein
MDDSSYQNRSTRYQRPLASNTRHDSVHRNFQDFIKQVWHNPLNTKIHQATNLRSIVVSLSLQQHFPHPSKVLELVESMYIYFPPLKDLTIYVVEQHAPCWSPSPSLEEEEEQLSKKFKMSKMEKLIEELGTGTLGVGFQCNWLGTGGERDVLSWRRGVGERRLLRMILTRLSH